MDTQKVIKKVGLETLGDVARWSEKQLHPREIAGYRSAVRWSQILRLFNGFGLTEREATHLADALLQTGHLADHYEDQLTFDDKFWVVMTGWELTLVGPAESAYVCTTFESDDS